MKPSRLFAVTTRVLQDLRNDRRQLALIFVAPLLVITIFGVAFTGDVKDVRVVVVNGDTAAGSSSLSNKVISNFDTGVLNVAYANNESDGVAQVQNGSASAVIVFPSHFTQSVAARAAGQTSVPQENVTIKLLADKSNPNLSNAIIAAVNNAVAQTIVSQGHQPPATVDSSNAIYGANAQFIDFFAPGIICIAVWQLTTLLTLISFVGERTSGTLLRLLASPLKESELVTGYAAAFGVIGTVQSAVLLAAAVILFNVTIVGNVLLTFVVIALLAIVSEGLGILLSSLARREAQAVQFLPFIILPAFLLSGVFWPIQAIPTWLRPVSYLLPPTYAVEAVRSVILRGWGLDKIYPDIAALVIFAAVFLTLATISLRRRA
ncbi:MAG TPA: ABC transporter permease [Candidatus Acidoferrales bacterium]|jgi:ABC-2 type transport system permease protein|nr:ABC transporter permease [Candidatus Acidoferrales bacterium]